MKIENNAANHLHKNQKMVAEMLGVKFRGSENRLGQEYFEIDVTNENVIENEDGWWIREEDFNALKSLNMEALYDFGYIGSSPYENYVLWVEYTSSID